VTTSAPIALSVEDDPPPVVRAIARDLAACLEDPSFADATRRAAGVVGIRSASTPEAVTLRIADGAISIAHGTTENAEVTATAELSGTEDADPHIEGSGKHPELAEWLSRVLDPPAPRWPDAAERFWAVLSRMRGAPDGLLVIDLDGGDRRRFGSEVGSACEIQGSPDGLVAVFTGRTSVMEAAFEGTVYVRGRFPDLSVLSGAGFQIRYGGRAPDG
jgi:hypothetical protein